MSRFARKDGIVVSVADEHDHRYGAGWKKLADGETFTPPAPRRTRQQHDEPTPSGAVRTRTQSEETPTGQIRRQQAADPFYGR